MNSNSLFCSSFLLIQRHHIVISNLEFFEKSINEILCIEKIQDLTVISVDCCKEKKLQKYDVRAEYQENRRRKRLQIQL
ncbi:MAG: hypothetical protein K9W44_03210 [Candidatus Lokiarchaeota archaeon]|nr:hypothetical protein [Candidatus Harpocratesius repetitus]